MQSPLYLYNTLTRRKEPFEPLHPPFVGMYVCGPTVYSETHLGHARPAITFDILFRWLQHLGYRVRYVRNITDVGHLENDADSGEDKIGKKARLEQLEPMEIVQRYMNSFHYNMHCSTVAIVSMVGVFVIDWIRMGEPSPICLLPIRTFIFILHFVSRY